MACTADGPAAVARARRIAPARRDPAGAARATAASLYAVRLRGGGLRGCALENRVRLQLVETRESRIALQKLRRRTLFGNTPLIERDHPVGVTDRAHAMGDDQH